MAKSRKRTPATRKPTAGLPVSGSPVAPAGTDPRDTLLYTIGFTLAAFFFIIGVYQSMVEEDLPGNYWLFMVSAGLLLGLRAWRQKRLRG